MLAENPSGCGLTALAYYFPPKVLTLDDLARGGALHSSKDQLRDFGFRKIRVAEGASAADLAERAVRKLLRRSRITPEQVDVILYASALAPAASRRGRGSQSASALFRYPASRLQYRLGMTRAHVIGVSQAGCVSFLSAVRLARDILVAEAAIRRVLCVGGDVLPRGEKREILYNLISDGACAALVERGSPANRIVAYSQVTKGFYWDSEDKENEIVASYFPTARFVIQEALRQAGLRVGDIRLILPHNVNRASWDLLLSLIDAPKEKFFGRNIASRGHTIAADNIINLDDAIRLGRVRSGDYVLLFTFGFGAHWACMILRC